MRHSDNETDVLLISSRFDVTCDYIIRQLRKRAQRYLRLNTEDLQESIVELDPLSRHLRVERDDVRHVVTPSLRSVLFRRPVSLREYGDNSRSPTETFARYQWAAFVLNLMLFDEARWINTPSATYRAEHKALQLAVATSLGFAVPDTRVTNAPHRLLFEAGHNRIAVKGLDTVLVRADGHELFGYTTLEDIEELKPSEWRSAPATIQAALEPKIDIRVTVVEDRVFPVSITNQGRGIAGDWRVLKNHATYANCTIPNEVATRCIRLVEALGLVFGGVDLALANGEYYFLEVNPTGEWSWLVDATGAAIDAAIADALSRRR